VALLYYVGGGLLVLIGGGLMIAIGTSTPRANSCSWSGDLHRFGCVLSIVVARGLQALLSTQRSGLLSEATPHVTYRTSVVTWIVLGCCLQVFVCGHESAVAAHRVSFFALQHSGT
jgi:hypothetical protein